MASSTPSTPPRYTRATAASASRATPKAATAKMPPKLKRPLGVLYNDRESRLVIPSARRPVLIRPADRTKPCPLATLPVEIRLLIFEYAFDRKVVYLHDSTTYTYRKAPGSTPWPALLRVSRLIRNEAAYIFYTQTHFFCSIKKLDFRPVQTWMRKLPHAHRVFLARNPNLQLDITVCLAERSPAFPGYNMRWERWIPCEAFGNIHNFRSKRHKAHFLTFCKLAEWWLWCARPVFRDIRWNYGVEVGDFSPWNRPQALLLLMNEGLLTVALPCVQEAWVKERKESMMKKEALNMLAELDRAFQGLEIWSKAGSEHGWQMGTALLRRFLEKW